MQTVSIGISGVGMTQFLCMGLGNVFQYADLQNRWAQNYQPLLPHWAFPDPAVLPDFYAGQSTLFTGAAPARLAVARVGLERLRAGPAAGHASA